MRYLNLLIVLIISSCASIDSVESSIYKGMSKSNFCGATLSVMVNEDPCTGKTYSVNSNTEVITNEIQSKFYIFQNKKLVDTAYSYSGALSKIKQGNGKSKRSEYSSATISQSTKPASTYTYKSAETNKKTIHTYASSTTNSYQCISAKSELENAKRKLRQANNYYNLNSLSCRNSAGRSCMIMPKQCQNRAYQCQNRSASCRAGDYACTSRESNRYYQCRSAANNEYNQCQNRARQAAENYRRNCESQKEKGKSQCLSRVKREQNNLISQANVLQSNANRKVAQVCN